MNYFFFLHFYTLVLQKERCHVFEDMQKVCDFCVGMLQELCFISCRSASQGHQFETRHIQRLLSGYLLIPQ